MNPISSNNLIPLVLIGFFEEAASCMARGATRFAHRTKADSKATISITSHELGEQHLMPAAIGVVSMVILVGGLFRYFWPQTNTEHSTDHNECNGAIINNNLYTTVDEATIDLVGLIP